MAQPTEAQRLPVSGRAMRVLDIAASIGLVTTFLVAAFPVASPTLRILAGVACISCVIYLLLSGFVRRRAAQTEGAVQLSDAASVSEPPD